MAFVSFLYHTPSRTGTLYSKITQNFCSKIAYTKFKVLVITIWTKNYNFMIPSNLFFLHAYLTTSERWRHVPFLSFIARFIWFFFIAAYRVTNKKLCEVEEKKSTLQHYSMCWSTWLLKKNTLINREMNKYWSILWCLKILTKKKVLIKLDTWLVADWNENLYLRSNEIMESEL